MQPQKYLGDHLLELQVTDRYFLTKMDELLDWAALEGRLSELSTVSGKSPSELLVCLKMLLMEDWYGFSHSQCAAQSEDRLSFRRFLGLSQDDAVPDEKVLACFRKQLVDSGVSKELFASVRARIESAGVMIKKWDVPLACDCEREADWRAAGSSNPEIPALGLHAYVDMDVGSVKTLFNQVQAPHVECAARPTPVRVKLSIVATLYKSAPYIVEFHQRAGKAARHLVGEDYEIVLVNDGSPDESLKLAVQLSEVDHHLVVVDLSRNFGHHKAIVAGLEQATGEHIFLIDSDLEEEPEWLPDFAALMTSEKADVVYGQQQERKGSWFEKWSGEVYYTVFNWLCNIDHPRNIVTARLMTRRYVDSLLQYKEREAVISCLWVSTGFKQCGKIVKKHSTSSSTYSLSKKISHAINAITSFSEVPLRLIFYLGITVLVCAIGYAGYLSFNRVFLSQPMDGWTSVMVSIWVFGGTIISFVGIIGIYLAKVFSESKQRPNAIVRDVYGRSITRD